jgi:hypothetical protein
MNKIVNYISIDAKTPSHLDSEVKEWMKNGWQPFGSPYKWNGFIVQVLVKYENN